jgi:hypothetical protein
MATLANFGIAGGFSGHLHPQMKNKWRVTFLDMGRLVSGTNSRNLTMQATTVNLPQLEFENVQINRYNSTSYVAGKYTWSTTSMVVEDDITGLAKKVITGQLETQQRLVGVDLDGRWLNTAATGSDYKFGMKIEQLDGDEGVTSTWIFEGVFISAAEFGDLDYADSGAVTISLTLRFDHVRNIVTGDGYGTALGGNVAG